MEKITNKRRMPFLAAFAFLGSAVCLLGCSSTKAAATQITPGDVLLTAEVRENDSGATYECVVSLNPKSRAKMTGFAERDAEGDLIMTVEQFHWFNNWHDGWTDADLVASGKLRLTKEGSRWLVSPLEKIVLEQTTTAKIRYRDDILSGNEAAALFDRRIGRVTATAEWIAEALPREYLFKPFLTDAEQLLFPERFGYPEGTKASPATKENRRRGEGCVWDTQYTRDTIPELLREVRDTGTLYRDWEESAELFYFIYTQELVYE